MKKPNIQEGDIILVHTKKGFLAKGIRFFTKCHYNHAAIVIEAMDELCVLESIGRGLMITKTLDAYLLETPKEREISVRRPVNQVVPDKFGIYSRLRDIIGHPYDYKSLLYSQLIQQLTKKYRWKGERDIKASKRIYCSEACAYAYPKIFPNWWAISPADIFRSKKLKEVFKM